MIPAPMFFRTPDNSQALFPKLVFQSSARQIFPGFAYQSFIVNVDVEYKGRFESLFLPESQLAIDKAVRRLGAESIDDCDLVCEYENPNFGRFSVRFEEILDNEGIAALNALAYEFYTYDIDTEKLDAAMEMTDVKSSKNIITLINHLDEFEWLNDISYGDYEGIGRFFVDSDYYDDYEISDELYGKSVSCGFPFAI